MPITNPICTCLIPGMAYKKQRPLPSQYSGSSSSGSSSSSSDDEAVEDQRPREVPPPKRPATKRKGKGKMMKPSSQGNKLLGIMYIY